MTDPAIDAEVRRMRHSSRSVLIGLLIGIAVMLLLAMLIVPFVSQPSINETLPKVLETKTPTKPDPTDQPAIDLSLPDAAPQGAKSAASQTVIVAYTSPDGASGTIGSGLLIGPGLVLTAAHLHDSKMGEMLIGIHCEGRRVDGLLIKQAVKRDIAFIRAPGCEAKVVRISKENLDADDALYVAGFTFSSDGRHTWAKRYFEEARHVPNSRPDTAALKEEAAELVRSMRANKLPELEALHDNMIPGQSGSPVFLASGELVGVLIMSYPRLTQRFMVPASSIAAEMKEARITP